MRSQQNSLKHYLTATAGIGAAVSTANGAVTFFTNTDGSSDGSAPAGLIPSVTNRNNTDYFYVDTGFTYSSVFARTEGDDFNIFTDGLSDIGISTDDIDFGGYFLYIDSAGVAVFTRGASSGVNNFANISLTDTNTESVDANNVVFESVAQFSFDEEGNGFLIAIASSEEGALSITEGRALIEAAAIPEPSGLTLLALGSLGLAARRNRKKAA